jgi:hypothetical protein
MALFQPPAHHTRSVSNRSGLINTSITFSFVFDAVHGLHFEVIDDATCTFETCILLRLYKAMCGANSGSVGLICK